MDFFFHPQASFLCQTTFIKMPSAILNNSFIRNTVQSQLSKILTDGNFSLLKDSPLPSSSLVTRDCLITQWALNLSWVQTGWIHWTFHHIISLTFKQPRFEEDYCILPVWTFWGFLGGTDDLFHSLDLDSVWIWITLSGHHDCDFLWGALNMVPPYEKSAFNLMGYASLYEEELLSS